RGDLVELTELVQNAPRTRRFFGVNTGDGEADVDEHELPRLGIRFIGEADAAGDASEAHLGEAHAVALVDLEHLAGNCQTHAGIGPPCQRRAVASWVGPRCASASRAPDRVRAGAVPTSAARVAKWLARGIAPRRGCPLTAGRRCTRGPPCTSWR